MQKPHNTTNIQKNTNTINQLQNQHEQTHETQIATNTTTKHAKQPQKA